MNDLGALCWHELVTADLDRAKSFYGELLGWEYQALPSGHTTITKGAN
jgi:predicted enzyme related to lactoylglutathione lyase